MAASSSSSLLLLFLISLFSTAFTSMNGFTDDPLIQQVVSSYGHDDLLTSAEHQFSEFKKKYGKTYPTEEEEDYRFGVFISNLRLARRNQIMDPTAVHGVTKFSDLRPSEFQRHYLGSDRGQMQLPKDILKAPILSTDDLPHTINWTKEGAVTAVKNQTLNCDGCWAFSTIAVLEGAHFLANRELLNLSEQQLIDCSNECKNPELFVQRKNISDQICNEGCKGGHRILAFRYMEKNGVVKAEDYRFIGANNGFCNVTENSEIVASLCDFAHIEREDQYASNLVDHGPIAVSIPIKYLGTQTYTGGILCPEVDCTSNEIKETTQHAVVLVGYDDGTTTKTEFSWIVKNSWGIDWGEGGYFRVCRRLLLACNHDPVAIYATAKIKTAPECPPKPFIGSGSFVKAN